MLSDSNIKKINDEIESELRWISSSDHEDKMQTLERVAALKALLDPTPTAEQIVAALKTPELPNDLTRDLKSIFDTFRR